MEESNKGVEAKHPSNHASGEKRQNTGSSQNKKPVALRAQAKSSGTKSQTKASTSAFKGSRSPGSVSSALKDNATRAEALEHENVATQNKNVYSKPNVAELTTEKTPNMDNETQGASPIVPIREADIARKDSAGKLKKKDKLKPLVKPVAAGSQGGANVKADPDKALKTLEKKTIKSEKKVGKLKRKVKKAEKRNVKKSKLRLLKEKLLNAFSKWQRRKKKLEKAPK